MRSVLAVALSLGLAAPALGCDGELFELMDEPLGSRPQVELDVEERQSAEGGGWEIYLREDGKARNILRTDYGEGGRFATQLFVQSPQAFAVTTTLYIYSAPIYVERSTTIREEKSIYIFCDGKLYLPDEDIGLGDEYASSAAEALATFDAQEIAQYLPPLQRQ